MALPLAAIKTTRLNFTEFSIHVTMAMARDVLLCNTSRASGLWMKTRSTEHIALP